MPNENSNKAENSLKGIIDMPVSRRAVFAGLGMTLMSGEEDRKDDLTDVKARGEVRTGRSIALFSYSDVVHDDRGRHYNYAEVPYGKEVVNWEKGAGGRGITWFRSIYSFYSTGNPRRIGITFTKEIDCTLEVGNQMIWFGEDVHLRMDGRHICSIIPSRAGSGLYVLTGEKKRYSVSYEFDLPLGGGSIHFDSESSAIPEVPAAPILGGSAFDFYIDFPGWDRVVFRKFSSNETVGDFPNGLYRIRWKGNRNMGPVCSWRDRDVFMYTFDQFPEKGTQPKAGDQLWVVGTVSSGAVQIAPSYHANMRLNVAGGTTEKCDVWHANGAAAQDFWMERNQDGSYLICPKSLPHAALTVVGTDLKFLEIAPEGSSARRNQSFIMERLQERRFDPTGERADGAVYDIYTESACENHVGSCTISNGVGDVHTNDGFDRLERGKHFYARERTAARDHQLSCSIISFFTNQDRQWIWMANEPVGKVPVHFMLNDENGDVHELHVEDAKYGTRLDLDSPVFSQMNNVVAQRYGSDRVAQVANKWFYGDQYDFDYEKKFDSTVVTTEIWLWMEINTYKVQFFKDGNTLDCLVFESPRIVAGLPYALPPEAMAAAIEPCCNLNSNFGQNSSNGFTGWFLNKELTKPAPSDIVSDSPGVIKIYGRNRATLRVAYASDSVQPKSDGDYRTAPREDAPVYARAMQLPDFSREPSHRLDNTDLPATGDWGDGHACGYYDEVLTLPGYPTVYERLGDGRWRTYRCEGWRDEDGIRVQEKGKRRSLLGFRSPSSSSGARVQMKGDTTRTVRWVIGLVDGVETKG